MIKHPLAVVLLMMTCAGAQNLSSKPDAPVETPSKTSGSGYLVGPDDVLEVFAVDVAELSQKYRVSPDGFITIPLLKTPVQAAGRSLDQLSHEIENDLRNEGVISRPHLTIAVVESKIHSVAVTGAVKKPQIYPVFSRTTLLDILAQAEGLQEDASGIALIRRGDIGLSALGLQAGQADAAAATTRVDLKALLETGDPSLNVEIYPGDRVTIPRAGIVYVVGAVNKPGGFPMRAGHGGAEMSALQALALAEDAKPTAIRNKAVIVRTAADGKRTEIPVDLKRTLKSDGADAKLQADDILFIPDSSSKRALRRGAEAIVQVATGVAVYGRF